MLDGYRGVEDTLKTGRVDLLKINRAEISILVKEADMDRAIAKLFDTWVLLTF